MGRQADHCGIQLKGLGDQSTDQSTTAGQTPGVVANVDQLQATQAGIGSGVTSIANVGHAADGVNKAAKLIVTDIPAAQPTTRAVTPDSTPAATQPSTTAESNLSVTPGAASPKTGGNIASGPTNDDKSTLPSASAGSGSPPSPTPAPSAPSTPPSGTDSSGPTSGGSGGGAGGGGGGSTATGGAEPDDGSGASSGSRSSTPPTVQIDETQIETITKALAAITQAVREGSPAGSAGPDLIELRADILVLSSALKAATATGDIASEKLVQLASAVEDLSQEVATLREGGKTISINLEKLGEQATKLAEALIGTHFKQIVDGLKDVKSACESGAEANKALLKQILKGLESLKDPTQLAPDQLNQILEAIKGVESAETGDNNLMNLMLQELKALKETLQKQGERNSDAQEDSKQGDRVREDYPVITHHQKQDVLDVFKDHLRNLRDPNCNPYTLDVRDVIAKLSAFQRDPQDPSKLWIDENCTYRPRDASEFTDEMRKEIQDFLNSSKPHRDEMLASDFMRQYRLNNPAASAKQLNEALINAYIDGWCRNNTVAFLHVLVPPIINDKLFRVRYVTAEGNVRTFEMDLESFRRDLNKCHSKGRGVLWMAGLAVGALSLGTAAVPAATGLIVAGVLSLGSLALVNSSWNLGLRRESLALRYNSLIFTETLDLALNATSSAAICLPVLAHYHFIRTCPKHTRALELGKTDMVGNSPIKYLQKHLLLFDYLVKNWEVFETNCDNFSTRLRDSVGVTNKRQREVDEQKLRVVREDAAKFEGTVMRWTTIYHWTAWASTICFSLGVGTLVAGAILAPFKLVASKLRPTNP